MTYPEYYDDIVIFYAIKVEEEIEYKYSYIG